MNKNKRIKRSFGKSTSVIGRAIDLFVAALVVVFGGIFGSGMLLVGIILSYGIPICAVSFIIWLLAWLFLDVNLVTVLKNLS